SSFEPTEDTKSGFKISEGVLTKAVRLSHDRKVVLVLDEWDKTHPSADAFMLDFLQHGRIHFRGHLEVAKKSNLYVFLTMNYERALSEPLLRRLPLIEVGYPATELVETVLRQITDDEALIKLALGIYSSSIAAGLEKPATIQELKQFVHAVLFLREQGDEVNIDDLVFTFITKSKEQHEQLANYLRQARVAKKSSSSEEEYYNEEDDYDDSDDEYDSEDEMYDSYESTSSEQPQFVLPSLGLDLREFIPQEQIEKEVPQLTKAEELEKYIEQSPRMVAVQDYDESWYNVWYRYLVDMGEDPTEALKLVDNGQLLVKSKPINGERLRHLLQIIKQVGASELYGSTVEVELDVTPEEFAELIARSTKGIISFASKQYITGFVNDKVFTRAPFIYCKRLGKLLIVMQLKELAGYGSLVYRWQYKETDLSLWTAKVLEKAGLLEIKYENGGYSLVWKE
ncbi:MAG: hypothetical protein P3W91_005125, partial [Fervidobacterium sp.]|nr:hypothetical protein [Fervidobacterium sp.]